MTLGIQASSQTSVPLCQVCKERAAIRAHLIPEAFVKEIYYSAKADEKHIIVHNDKGFKISSTTGRYERDLLCGECDGRLGAYEDAALRLMKRLRQIRIGRKSGSDSTISPGLYHFRVPEADSLIRFACGILWKYASIASSNPAFVDVGDLREVFEHICFSRAEIPASIDVFIERDLFSYAAFGDPNDVYYYATPSIGTQGGQRMAWFSVGGFIIYVRLDEGGHSDFAPKRCWLKGRKACSFLVSMRSLYTNSDIARSIGVTSDDLARLNRKIARPKRHA